MSGGYGGNRMRVALVLSGLTRTQLRRSQRKHTLACLRQGVRQSRAYASEVQNLPQLVEALEVLTIAKSIATYRSDCKLVGQPIQRPMGLLQ